MFRFGPFDIGRGSVFRYRYRFDPQGPNAVLAHGICWRHLRRRFDIGRVGVATDILGLPSSRGLRASLYYFRDGIKPTLEHNIFRNPAQDYQCYWLAVDKAGVDTFVQIPLTRWDVDFYCQTIDMQESGC